MNNEKIRVMVVDDSLLFRSVLSNALKGDNEIEVVGTAMNGKAALLAIERLNPHVMTLDVEMPDMDGRQCLKEVKSKYPDIQVIMVSSLTSEGAETTVKCLELGASDFILKAGADESASTNVEQIKKDVVTKIKRAYNDKKISDKYNTFKKGSTIDELQQGEKTEILDTATQLILPGKKPLCLFICCEEHLVGHLLLLMRNINFDIAAPILFKIMVPEVFLNSLVNSFERGNSRYKFIMVSQTQDLEPGTVYLAGENHKVDLLSFANSIKLSTETSENNISIDHFLSAFQKAKVPNTPVFLVGDDPRGDGMKALADLTVNGIPTVLSNRNARQFEDKKRYLASQVVDLNLLPIFIQRLFRV